jgi:hypothetical protein
MSVQVGDTVKIDSYVLSDILHGFQRDFEATVVNVDGDDTGAEFYVIQIKLPAISVYEDEVKLLARQKRSRGN